MVTAIRNTRKGKLLDLEISLVDSRNWLGSFTWTYKGNNGEPRATVSRSSQIYEKAMKFRMKRMGQRLYDYWMVLLTLTSLRAKSIKISVPPELKVKNEAEM